jgi:signal transduction histidine kinase
MTPSTDKLNEQSGSNRDICYQWIEIIGSLLLLLFLLFFSYTEIFLKPDMGFTINWNDGLITSVDEEAEGYFKTNDRILTINDISPYNIKYSVRENPLVQTPEGGFLEFILIRDGNEIRINYPKPSQGDQILLQIVSGDWILPYPFFTAGIITILFVRPRTLTRLLLILFFYTFAVWISAGLISTTGYWASPTIMRVVMWLSVPIAFHLHWRFPTPFKFKRKWINISSYCLFSLIGAAEILTTKSGSQYMFAFIVLVVSSFVILVVKFFHFKEYRKILRSLLFAYLLAILPLLVMVILVLLGSAPSMGNVALLGLTAIPGFYFYSAYRVHIKREIPRVNAAIRLFSLLILLNSIINFTIVLLPSGSFNAITVSFISFFTIILISMTGFGILLVIPALANDQVDLYRTETHIFRLSANRAAAFVFYVVLSATFSLTILSLCITPHEWQIQDILISSAINVLMISFSILFYRQYQKLYDKFILGIKLPPEELIRDYAHSISTSLEKDTLAALIKEVILPSLLIRESVLLYTKDNPETNTLFSTGLSFTEIEKVKESLENCLPDADEKTILETIQTNSPWVRLPAPLKVKGKVIGVWCFGRKDPNEIYTPDLIKDLQSLANQTTLALLNIHQAELLQALYNANVNRQEEEKANLARDLHDVLLPSINYLVDLQENGCLPEEFEQAVQRINNMIRDLMSGLRPATLDMGLAIALEELADEPEAQIGGTINIQTQLSILEPQKYNKNAELHLYRMVQQASQNALEHAQASSIVIRGSLTPMAVDLYIEDDGIGFSIDTVPNLGNLIANQHFGLTNIYERAKIINAEVNINSQVNEGTSIHIHWLP